MTTHNCKTTSPNFQASTENYTRNGRQIASGHDWGTASYWYRIDGCALREFSSRSERDNALDVELQPITRIPDLPQLPANIPTDTRRPARKSRSLAWILTTYPKHIPSQGVICLSAPKIENKAGSVAQGLTKAQQRVADEFLKNAEDYFKALCDMDNAPLTPYEKRNLKWRMDCHFQNMSNKAFTYAQLLGQGVH
jgi:hypothetical protein